MFFRTKRSGKNTYLQLVKNTWEGGRTRQQVVATIGRLDKLVESGALESLLISGARFCTAPAELLKHFHGDKLLTLEQAARFLGIGQQLLQSRVADQTLPTSGQQGDHPLISIADLRELLKQENPAASFETGASSASYRIFVVDDDPVVISSIERSFNKYSEQCEVLSCSDGIEALVMIGRDIPDLVLLDIYMEGINGFEVCRRLRRMSHVADVKIIAMTAFPSEEARARVLDHGALDYWTKPIDPEAVIAVLEGEHVRSDAEPRA